jgi:putative hydrolase of the HAD superfamily
VNTYPDLLAIPMPEIAPPVVFLDAVGTLFGVRDGVGSIYRQFALDYGVDCEASAIEPAFYQAFKSADPGIFVGADRAAIPQLEYRWWQEINRQTFGALGQIDQFTDFEAFFGELYSYFATAAAWIVYPDTVPALERWQQRGWQLSVLSNFDTRLYQVLQELQLDRFFDTVTISTEVGAAKPDGQIFQRAITQAFQASGRSGSAIEDLSTIWHIGDSELEDYQGATNFGCKAWLLQRKSG